MKLKLKKKQVAAIISVVVGGIVSTVPAIKAQNRATIKIDGSSTVYLITEAVAEEFQA